MSFFLLRFVVLFCLHSFDLLLGEFEALEGLESARRIQVDLSLVRMYLALQLSNLLPVGLRNRIVPIVSVERVIVGHPRAREGVY